MDPLEKYYSHTIHHFASPNNSEIGICCYNQLNKLRLYHTLPPQTVYLHMYIYIFSYKLTSH